MKILTYWRVNGVVKLCCS